MAFAEGFLIGVLTTIVTAMLYLFKVNTAESDCALRGDHYVLVDGDDEATSSLPALHAPADAPAPAGMPAAPGSPGAPAGDADAAEAPPTPGSPAADAAASPDPEPRRDPALAAAVAEAAAAAAAASESPHPHDDDEEDEEEDEAPQQPPHQEPAPHAEFDALSRLARERQKTTKAMRHFVLELSTVARASAKAYGKLAQSAEALKEKEAEALHGWWEGLAGALRQLGGQQHDVANFLCGDLNEEQQALQQEQAHLEHTLSADGAAQVKERHAVHAAYDAAVREHGKVLAKVEQLLQRVQAGDTNEDASSRNGKKLFRKLKLVEEAKDEARARRDAQDAVFAQKMPQLLDAFRILERNRREAVQRAVDVIAQQLLTTGQENARVCERLRVDVENGFRDDYSLETKMGELRREDGSMDMWSDTAAALAAALPAALPKAVREGAGACDEETCVWLNAFVGRMYRDAIGSPHFHEYVVKKVTAMLNRGELAVSDISFGPLSPLFKRIKWVPSSTAGGDDDKFDVGATVEVLFRGGVTFTITTRLWLNWPYDRFAFLPVSVSIKLVELSGMLRFGTRWGKSYVSFLREPYCRFAVESSVGQSQKLKNLPKLSSIIINKIAHGVRTKLVYPKCKTFRLLWPKSWWPAEVLARAEAAAAAAAAAEEEAAVEGGDEDEDDDDDEDETDEDEDDDDEEEDEGWGQDTDESTSDTALYSSLLELTARHRRYKFPTLSNPDVMLDLARAGVRSEVSGDATPPPLHPDLHADLRRASSGDAASAGEDGEESKAPAASAAPASDANGRPSPATARSHFHFRTISGSELDGGDAAAAGGGEAPGDGEDEDDELERHVQQVEFPPPPPPPPPGAPGGPGGKRGRWGRFRGSLFHRQQQQQAAEETAAWMRARAQSGAGSELSDGSGDDEAAAAPELPEGCAHAGWLRVDGGVLGAKRRFGVLRDGTLHLFRNESLQTEKLAVPLRGCVCRPLERANAFELLPDRSLRGARKVTLVAASEEQRRAWIVGIQQGGMPTPPRPAAGGVDVADADVGEPEGGEPEGGEPEGRVEQ